jgi:NADP-dependent 3-hydroxy acid dehydrogenase YdfG
MEWLRNKVACITGHTGGIGGGISSHLQQEGFEIIGFSLENGYDLSDEKTIQKIINQSANCSVFVNCAQYKFSQTELLYGLTKRWKNDSDGRIILNISSTSSTGIWNFLHPYAIYKTALDTAAEQIWATIPNLKVMTLRPDIVDTKMSRKYNGKKLSTDDVANTALWMMKQPKNVLIKTITITSFGQITTDVYGERSRFNDNKV